ncbi:MAG: CotH kinase family protein, partial [Myxococcota bacterium]
LAYYDLKTGEGDATRLEAAASALASPTTDYYAMADEHFQMDQIIDYYAWMTVSANLDGYPFTLNDYFIYADPAAGGRFAMSPWGMDESWNPTFTFQWGVGLALFSCAADNACLDRVKARTEVALQHYESTDVPARLEAFYALSAARVANDPRSSWTPLEIETERAALLDFVRGWPDRLRAQMAAE